MRFILFYLGIAVLFIVLAVSIVSAQNRILFLHHSCGSNLFADDNGNLRQELTKQGFDVHDATYGDQIGQETNVCHWYPKFRDQYKKIMTFDLHPNNYYQNGEENDIIMFKSCYPNSNITSEGTAPGDPSNCTKNMWNYKAAYLALAEIFARHPEKLFVPVTDPPLVEKKTTEENAARARQFNNWLKTDYLKDYLKKTGLNNIAVFDFYAVLADSHNYLKKDYRRDDSDSHPNKVGNQAATAKFIPFIKQAVAEWEKTAEIQKK